MKRRPLEADDFATLIGLDSGSPRERSAGPSEWGGPATAMAV